MSRKPSRTLANEPEVTYEPVAWTLWDWKSEEVSVYGSSTQSYELYTVGGLDSRYMRTKKAVVSVCIDDGASKRRKVESHDSNMSVTESTFDHIHDIK